MEITLATAKYALVLLGVGGTAAGLNLGVMELASAPSAQPVEEEVLLSSGSDAQPQDPVQVIVDVPVVVPDSVLAGSAHESDAETVGTVVPAKVLLSGGPVQTGLEVTSSTTAPAPAPAPADTSPPLTVDEVASPASTNPTTSAVPRTTSAPTTTATTVEVARTTEYGYYDFPGVASEIIVAKHADGALEFWSVTSESGWSYRVEKDTPSVVEVEFSQEPEGEGEAKWVLRYRNGDLKVEKELSLEDEDEEDDRDDDDRDEDRGHDDDRDDDDEDEDGY